jgi:outer membrane murein-binding lipoprotein Lpp
VDVTVNPLEKRIDELAAHIERLQGRVDELAAGMVRMVSDITPGESELHSQVERLQHRVEELASGMVRVARDVTPREDELAAQVERLQHRVDELAGGMVRVAREVSPREEAGARGEGSDSGPTDIAAWMGASSLLPRISTLCFLLVVALILRTVTDSNIIDTHAGSILGMVYAASLLAAGWLRYGKGSAIAPVFSLSGALLMYSVVVETHSRFGSLPTLPAYLLLIGTGAAMALTARRAGNATPMVIGTLGMCAAGVALNFPSASLHLLALLLFAANVIAFRTVDLLRRDWMRWVVFALTGMGVQIWGARLAVPLSDPAGALSPPGASWFVPAAALFTAFFLLTAIVRMISQREERKRAFDYVVPAASAFVFFTAARHVAIPLWGSGLPLGAAGVVAASMSLGVASWMVRGRKLSALEFNSFTFAAVVLLVLSLSAATGALLVALPFLSLAAFHLASISDRWQSGGTRVISYLLQAFIAVALFGIMVSGEYGIPSLVGALAAGAVGVVAFLHYRWCRRHRPPTDSHVFSKIDRGDYSAASLLLVSLAGGFFLFRVAVLELLTALVGADHIANSFSGAQSLLINSAAIVLLLVAYRMRSREVRNVAILVILLGAAKVFLYDLVSVEGLARVFSVFSFGLVAAVASWVLGRWQKNPAVDGGDIPGEAAESGGGA